MHITTGAARRLEYTNKVKRENNALPNFNQDPDRGSHVAPVSVPDFPGCESVGTTVDNAIEATRCRALRWIATQLDSQQPVPPPTSLAHWSRFAADDQVLGVIDLDLGDSTRRRSASTSVFRAGCFTVSIETPSAKG